MDLREAFKPLDVGSLTLRNRFVFGPHTTDFAEAHRPSARHALYYERRAAGGVGLLIAEEQVVHPSDYPYERAIFGYDPAVVTANRILADSSHRHGAKIFVQINHYGQQGDSSLTRRPVWAPSPVPDVVTGEMPKAMEKEDIREVVVGFGTAARHAMEGGLDGVEIRASQSSLVRQFLSPLTNHRPDEYGGSLENRLRFCHEVLEAVRGEVGGEFVVGIRLCSDELAPWAGLTPDDAKQIARALDSTGRIDYIAVSMGSIYSRHLPWPSMHVETGFAVELATRIREAVRVPVMAMGRIHDVAMAQRIVDGGQADLVEMTRALIADEDLVRKAERGLLDQIRPCVACNQGCLSGGYMNVPMRCSVNPVVGHEVEFAKLEPTPAMKNVVVVGGGPAGLEAARVAAEQGHAVTVYEHEKRLGGRVAISAKGPGRQEWSRLISFLVHEIERLGVNVELGTCVEAGTLLELAPDAAIIATGSRPRELSFAVEPNSAVVQAADILTGQVEVDQRVVVYDEVGSFEAASVAEALAQATREVIIVTGDPFVGRELASTQDVVLWYQRVLPLGVAFLPSTEVRRFGDGVVILVDRRTREEWELGNVDAVVTVSPRLPNEDLYLSLKGKLKEVYRAGDCVAPRGVRAAILEGHRAGGRV